MLSIVGCGAMSNPPSKRRIPTICLKLSREFFASEDIEVSKSRTSAGFFS